MYYIGLDIGGTFIKAGLVNENGDIIKHSSIETKATRKAERVIEDMVAQIRELAAGVEYESVGIGCPGSIYSETGTVEYSNNLYWRKVPLGEMLKAELKKPVFVSNDANVAALGEAKFGAGKGYSDVIMITLGTGVGMGIVVDGKMFEGYRSMGGEGGHIVNRQAGGIDEELGELAQGFLLGAHDELLAEDFRVVFYGEEGGFRFLAGGLGIGEGWEEADDVDFLGGGDFYAGDDG